MEGNKDAAQKCMDIGNKALKDGDKVRAYRFFKKAQRLDPVLPLEGLLFSLAEEVEGDDSRSYPSARHADSEASGSGAGMSVANDDAAQPATPEYGSEQVEIIRQIRKTKDYYQILGLSRDCSAEDVRKAYRKVSLKVHPDKNKAPGAEEAFKAVSKAFASLNDPELRKNYDQYGPEEAQDALQRQGFRHWRNGAYYDEIFDPDEIFNSFFYGTSNGYQRAQFMRAQRTARQRGGGMHTQEVNSRGRLLSLLQLIPIFALLLFSLFPQSQPLYSLEQVASYQFQHRTKAHAIPFYVKTADFDKSHPLGSRSRNSIEAQVESEYTQALWQQCRRELTLRNWNPSLKTPYCDMLRQFDVR